MLLDVALYFMLVLSVVFTLVLLKKRTTVTLPLAIAFWIITGILYMTNYIDVGSIV